MVVVADASPLILLAAIGRLDLLRLLYGRVLLPAAVYQEVAGARVSAPGAAQAAAAEWLEVVTVHTPRAWPGLDEGEASALSLAIELQADLVVIDERAGRRVATQEGLAVIGVLGVLTTARRQGLVADLRHELTRLRDEAGIWISDRLFEAALRTADDR